MSSPAVAGVMSLMYERFKLNYSIYPEPSLAKSILINSADDLNDSSGYYNYGPDYASGFGHINATSAIALIDRKSFDIQNITNGGIYFYDFTNVKGDVRVTLV